MGVDDVAGLKTGKVKVTTANPRWGGECKAEPTEEFSRVVVANNAAAVPLLAKIDPELKWHLIGIKGCGLNGISGDASPDVDPKQNARAIHLLDTGKKFQAAYGRSTRDNKVKIWGGHDVHAEDHDMVPPYSRCSKAEQERLFVQGPS